MNGFELLFRHEQLFCKGSYKKFTISQGSKQKFSMLQVTLNIFLLKSDTMTIIATAFLNHFVL